MSIRFDFKDMELKFNALPPKVDAAVRMLAENGALAMQNYARTKAPWTDRTGNARQTLNGSVSSIPHGYRITLAHGVEYGIYLELCNEKRYGIIPDTIKSVGVKEVMPAFDHLMDRLGGS